MMKKTPKFQDFAPLSNTAPQMSHSNEAIARYETFHREVIMAYQRTDDGPKKDTAGLQLSIAASAAKRGHEVDFLLAVHRAMRALEQP